MSLMKSNNSGALAVRKNFNQTANVANTLSTLNKKAEWKTKTNKLVRTLTNPAHNPSSNIMTEEDINKLFGASAQTNFTNTVKFLRIDDEYDKFLTGLPEQHNPKIDHLFRNWENEDKDLTVEFKKNYLVGKIIGEGAYASVRIAIHKPMEKKIAIKIYEKAKIKQVQRKKSVIREIRILELLNHPNIVKIIDVVETNNHLNIVMEYLEGNSLGSFLKGQLQGKISEKHCKKIFKQLAKALAYMHSMNIAHRDIKLENIILDEELNPKIIDFGFSTCIEPDKKIKIFCGTPSYMAPEVVQRKEYRGEAADVWALGVMLFVCLTGIFPFKGATDQELYKKINNSDYPKGELIFSRAIADLMSRMLKVNPEQRITASEILKHPWFGDNKSDSSRKKTSQNSLQNNRRRINTLNSNTYVDNKWAHKTGMVKKTFLETLGKQNLQLEIKLALRSPKMTEVTSHRANDKQNTIKFLKSEKNTFRAKQNKPEKKEGEKVEKIQMKMIDLLKMDMRRKEAEKSKSKKRV